MIRWIPLTELSSVDRVLDESFTKDQIVFKHSPRCSISVMALEKLENAEDVPDLDFYIIDVVQNREVSLYLADKIDLIHQSPQLIQLRNAECIMDRSHWQVEMNEIMVS